jgi:hypothetical protein
VPFSSRISFKPVSAAETQTGVPATNMKNERTAAILPFQALSLFSISLNMSILLSQASAAPGQAVIDRLHNRMSMLRAFREISPEAAHSKAEWVFAKK